MIARIVALIAVCSTVLLCAVLLPLAAEPDAAAIENEFIRIVANQGPDEAGRFSIRTTGGDPSKPQSKNQHLIFGGNAPWTSYTSLRIDGENYAFGGPTKRRAGKNAKYGKQIAGPAVADGKLTCTYQFGDVVVTQELGFVRGTSTRMLDTCGITYKITNNGATAHQVGLRVMLDTMCGTNDGAPMRTGNQAITTATTLAGKEVTDYWQAFDSLVKPTVVSQGTLRGGNITAPDKVVFADWGTFADEPWDPALTAGQSFIRKGETEPDTATALYWNPSALEAGQSTSYLTYYGIGDVPIIGGKLTLGLTAPAETTFAHERTESFTITGYLQNAGGFEGHDISLSLQLPEGLSLVEGSKLKEGFDALKQDDTVQRSWVVRPNGKLGGKCNLTLSVTSANLEGNTLTKAIQVNVPTPKLIFTPDNQIVPAVTNNLTTIVPIQINLTPAENFQGARFVVKYNPAVVRPLGDPFGVLRGRAFVENGRLLQWSIDDSEDGVLVITGLRKNAVPITQAEANLGIIKFRAIGQGKTDLQFDKAVLIDDKGAEHPLDVAPGTIEVVP